MLFVSQWLSKPAKSWNREFVVEHIFLSFAISNAATTSVWLTKNGNFQQFS